MLQQQKQLLCFFHGGGFSLTGSKCLRSGKISISVIVLIRSHVLGRMVGNDQQPVAHGFRFLS
jgi:hypothetical protein